MNKLEVVSGPNFQLEIFKSLAEDAEVKLQTDDVIDALVSGAYVDDDDALVFAVLLVGHAAVVLAAEEGVRVVVDRVAFHEKL